VPRSPEYDPPEHEGPIFGLMPIPKPSPKTAQINRRKPRLELLAIAADAVAEFDLRMPWQFMTRWCTPGFLAVVESSIASGLFFEPVCSFQVTYATDLLAIESMRQWQFSALRGFVALLIMRWMKNRRQVRRAWSVEMQRRVLPTARLNLHVGNPTPIHALRPETLTAGAKARP
jgi:hypothetical protein